MMKNLLLFFCVIFTHYFTANAQRTCGTMEHLERIQKEDPGLLLRMQQIEQFTNRVLQNQQNQRVAEELGVIRIPVVVHVVYNETAQNISDAQIISQIEVLNEDFRKLNGDVTSVPEEFAGLTSDAGIEFYLATEDPEGNPTNGITRTFTESKKFGTNDNVKKDAKGGKNPWPTDKYLNLWSCNLSFFLGELLGYAQFPGGDPATDGVVINYKYFGRGGSALAPYDKGRTATHEVGHWLNLRHIWGDGGCGATDFVEDTPDAQSEYYGCPAYPQVSCGTSDMFMNYMDYVNDACMFMFSEGQKARMRALFEPGGARESFVQDTVVNPVDYCASTSQENLAWIEGVRINTTTTVSGSDAGYGDYTATAVEVNQGGTYLIGAQAGFANKKAALNWRFWIDYNQDGDFGDSGELVYEGKSKGIAKTNVTIPATVAEGVTRVRISAKYGAYPSPCETFQYGEVEDYTVDIQGSSSKLSASKLIKKDNLLSVYPNPSAGETVVKFNVGTVPSSAKVLLSDPRGKVVAVKQLDTVTGEVSEIISTTGLKPGIYFVEVQSSGINRTQKLIVK